MQFNPTTEQIEELSALALTNDAVGGPSFLRRSYYRDPVVGPLIRHGLIAWGLPPAGFCPRKFAGTSVTDAGKQVVNKFARLESR